MCAKFNGLAPSANGGLIGCLKFEPKLFGQVPVDFDFPCFDLNNEEIRVIDAPVKTEEEKQEEGEPASKPDSDETIGGFRVEDILSVVSKTADQGIKIIGELLGIGEDEKPENVVAATGESKTEPEVSATTKTP